MNTKESFSTRLAQLRTDEEISAREMSLDLGRPNMNAGGKNPWNQQLVRTESFAQEAAGQRSLSIRVTDSR